MRSQREVTVVRGKEKSFEKEEEKKEFEEGKGKDHHGGAGNIVIYI